MTAEAEEKDIEAMVTRAHRIRWVSLTIGATVMVLAVAALGILFWISRQQIQASCDVWKDISGARIQLAPKQTKPGKLLVRFIDDSREAFTKGGCPGPLPLPDPQLQRWEQYYHLPIR